MLGPPEPPKRSKLGTASIVIGAIGLLCCATSLTFVFAPRTLSSFSEPVHSVRGSSGDVLESGLELIRLKLVDPDAQSDELEDPAILLDPESLEWEGGNETKVVLDLDEPPPSEVTEEDGEKEDEEQNGEDNEKDELTSRTEVAGENLNFAALTRKKATPKGSDSTTEGSKPSSSSSSASSSDQKQSISSSPVSPISSRSVSDTDNPAGEVSCALTKELLAYTINRINASELSLDPYPHLIISKIFEPSFYQHCLLPKLPPTEAYMPLPNNRDRKQIPFSGKFGWGPRAMNRVGRPSGKMDAGKAKLMDVKFWTQFGQLFGSKTLMEVWLKKFYPTTKYRNVVPKLNNMNKNYWYTMSLGRDLKGYSIGPHTDTADKWVTTLFYLPRDNKHPELGTVVVRSKSGKTAKGNFRGRLDGRDFVIAKKAPFVRNTVMAFSACEGSWHAVQKVKGSIRRDTIQGFVNGVTAGGKKTCGKPGDALQPRNSWWG